MGSGVTLTRQTAKAVSAAISSAVSLTRQTGHAIALSSAQAVTIIRTKLAPRTITLRILAVVNDLSREPGAGGRWRRARAEILLSGQNWENLQLTAKLTRPARHPGRPCRRDLGRRVDYSGRATGSTTAPSSSSPFSSRPLGPLRYTFSGAATAFRSAAEVGHDLARRRQHLRVRRTDQRNDVRNGHRPLDRDQRAGRGRDELADLPERSGARPAWSAPPTSIAGR